MANNVIGSFTNILYKYKGAIFNAEFCKERIFSKQKYHLDSRIVVS